MSLGRRGGFGLSRLVILVLVVLVIVALLVAFNVIGSGTGTTVIK